MKTLIEQRADALKAANDVVAAAKDEKREQLNPDEVKSVNAHLKTVDDIDLKMAAAKDSEDTLRRLGVLTGDRGIVAPASDDSQPAKSLGEHFVKHAGTRLKEIRGVQGASASAPEFLSGLKAATDTHATGGPAGPMGLVLTEVDRTIVQAYRPRLVIADLLGSGTMSGQAITYFVEGALDGAYTTVAEGAAKPQLHVNMPTTVTDALKKIAGWIKLTDEMMEDLAYLVSEINVRLQYELGRFEEQQVLQGDGTGTNVLGVMNRSGIQTETGADSADNPDALFRAMTKINTVSGLDADGIVIHPLDYQNFRLMRDANSQYFGGGFFQGEYGNGAILSQPPIWGMRTVVTPAIPVGTALVGAFTQATTLYRKGGVRVESTNSHASDFVSNLVTVRAEERIALAVRKPSGLVKVTLGTG